MNERVAMAYQDRVQREEIDHLRSELQRIADALPPYHDAGEQGDWAREALRLAVSEERQ